MRDMKILPIRHVMIYFAYICVPFIGRIAKDGELYSRAYNSGESPPRVGRRSQKYRSLRKVPFFSPGGP